MLIKCALYGPAVALAVSSLAGGEALAQAGLVVACQLAVDQGADVGREGARHVGVNPRRVIAVPDGGAKLTCK